MPRRIAASSQRIRVTNLSPESFAQFGEVIQNPRTHDGEPTLQTVEANQGSATKWLDVGHMEDFYERGSSKTAAKCVMNMFVCRPRKLKRGRLFDVGILERHPYTPQTFTPMGLGKHDRGTAYLVVVAPTLPEEAWQDLEMEGSSPTDGQSCQEPAQYQTSYHIPKGSGPPDMANLKAFIAGGDQAVTYGPGTWHAPMVVLGESEIEFLVVQYANGVADEDCQEVVFAVDRGDGIEVEIGDETRKAKL